MASRRQQPRPGAPSPQGPNPAWTDDLPAKPIKNALLPRLIMGLVLLGLWHVAAHGIKAGEVPNSFLGHPFRKTFTGNGMIDTFLAYLTRLFSLALDSPVAEQRIQLGYILCMLTPTVLIWVVEGHRRANLQAFSGRVLTFPGFWALMYQTFAIARTGPIYFLFTLLASLNPLYYRPTARVVDVDVARSVLPAVVLGYVISSVLLCLPHWSSPGAWLDLATLWQVAPVIVGPLTVLFASILRRLRSGNEDADVEVFKCKDLPHLLTAYATLFWTTAAAHLCTLAYFALSAGRLSLYRAFFDVPLPWGPLGDNWMASVDPREAFFVVLRWDQIIMVATSLAWCLWNVFEMRRLGYTTTTEALRVAAAVAASPVMVGPGAMYAGTWYWREKKIAETSKMEQGDGKKER
ncbi:hypothetical protein MAPG_01310 [Magnaporthiopsis poae ATCC 64411]|uniref:Uncharacterized protein n=1 Tax=Magnaporthiopsis poae (strain ATCC 64411 / 73-15) TaxID=644358 RepID=A0A0C4DNC9_MAGP6|nr:hypothetical protein MAPG_01310 [Magnaporthiopsis poae ATCC 64411]